MTGSGTDHLGGRTHACIYRHIHLAPSGKWRGRLYHGGRTLNAGHFDTPNAAAHAVDRIIYKVGRQAELQTEVSNAEKGVLDRMNLEEVLRDCQASGKAANKARESSRYQGVSAHGNAWHAFLYIANRYFSSGYYSTELAAARSRDCAMVLSNVGAYCRARQPQLNFPREDYQAADHIRTDYLEGREYNVPDSWFLSSQRVKLVLNCAYESNQKDSTERTLDVEGNAIKRPDAPGRPKKKQRTIPPAKTLSVTDNLGQDCIQPNGVQNDRNSLEADSAEVSQCNADKSGAEDDSSSAPAMSSRTSTANRSSNVPKLQEPDSQKCIDDPWPKQKEWDRVKALCHLCPDLEEFLSEEEEGDDEIYEFYMQKKSKHLPRVSQAELPANTKARIHAAAKALHFKRTFGVERKDVAILTQGMKNHGPWYDAIMNPGPDYIASPAERELMDQIEAYIEEARITRKSKLLCQLYEGKRMEVVTAVLTSRERIHKKVEVTQILQDRG